MAATKGTARLFNIQGYKKIVVPIGFLMTLFSITVYISMTEMFGFISVYKYCAFPFQVNIPIGLAVEAHVIIWRAAEIKKNKEKADATSVHYARIRRKIGKELSVNRS